MLRTKGSVIPNDLDFHGKGAHDRHNAALALQAAQLFKISDDDARDILENWKGLSGRLELVKKVKNIECYNDAASVCASSTELAIKSLAENKNIVLIFGGAETASDYASVYALLPQHVRTIILLPGSGTIKERQQLNTLESVEVYSAPSLEEGARMALEYTQKGDKILFSPGFAVGGFDRSRLERGERFVRALKNL